MTKLYFVPDDKTKRRMIKCPITLSSVLLIFTLNKKKEKNAP